MKKIWGILWISLAVLLVVAGCGQQAGQNDSPQESNQEEAVQVEKVELTLWVAGNSPEIQATFNALISDFNEQYAAEGLTAKVQFVPWSELQQRLTTSLAGGVGPDVFMHGAAAAAGLAEGGQIEPLNRFLDQWADTDDFIESYLEAGKVNNDYYVLPIQGANRMMLYRTDIFEEAGVSVPSTWDEMLEISEKLVIKEGNRFIRAAVELPSEGIDLQQAWTPFLWSNGGDLFNEDFTQATLDTPEALEALQVYMSFFERDLAPISGMGGQGDQHPLGTGEVAFTFDGVWILDQIRTYTPDAYDKIGIAVPPAGKGEPTTLVGSSGFFINANSDIKDQAWTLMAYLGSKDSIAKIADELKFLPVRESLIDEEFIQEDPLFAQFVELSTTTNGKANPNIPQWTTVRDILALNLERALYGQLTPEEALNQAEEEINAALQE